MFLFQGQVMPSVRRKKICVNLPEKLINRLDRYVETHERSELVSELLAEYVEAIEAEEDHLARVEARRERIQMVVEKIRDSGRKAADMFLP